MRNVSYLILFIIVMLFAACQGNKKYDLLMQQADSIMDSSDEDAKTAIKALDGIKPQFDDLSKRQQMKYQLLYHKAMNKADIPFTSDSTMKQVADYYENHGSANERMLAYYVLGCVYRDLHEAPIALEYYNKATEQADTTSQECDYQTLSVVYGQMAVLFSRECFPRKELVALNNAMKYAYIAKDTLNAIKFYQNKMAPYDELGEKDSAFYINIHAAELFRKYGDDYDANISLGDNCEYYIIKKDYKKAKETFEAFQKTGYEGNTNNQKDAKAYILYQKGLYYLFIEQMDSAFVSFTQSYKLSESYNNKNVATKGLALYYTKTKKFELATKYALLSAEYNDSSILEIRNIQLQNTQALYDYNRNQELARKAEYEAKQIKLLTICGGILGSIMIALAVIVVRRKARRKNYKIMASRRLYEKSIQKLKYAEKEIETLKNFNKEKIANLIQEKEHAIIDLKNEIKKYSNYNKIENITDIDYQLKATSIYKKIKQIEHHPKETITDNLWKALEETMEKSIPAFIDIKHLRNINEKEYRICLLVRLGFSPSSISHFIGTSPSDITLSRKRMFKKICGREGTAKELDEYICNL